jgi:transcriptional regulator with XRE-family HTH domain
MSNLIGYTLAVSDIDYVYMSFGKAIAERRKHLGMTQHDLAEALGVQQSNISKIERRDVPIKDIFLLEALAKALECSVDDLRHCRVPAELIGVRLRPPGEAAPPAVLPETAAPRRHDEAESIAQMFRRVTAEANPADKAEMAAAVRDVLQLSFKRIRRVRRYLEADVEEQKEEGGGASGEGGEEEKGQRRIRPYRTRRGTINRPASGEMQASAYLGAR